MASQFVSRYKQPPALRAGSAPVVAGNESFSHQDLQAVLDKFLRVQRDRQRLTRLKLDARCQSLLEALPLLLHCNHPALPGFHEGSCPAGIMAYTPQAQACDAVRGLFHVHLLPSSSENPEIQAVYMMGSAGSVAQTRRSDIDLWVCLPASAHPRLRPKLDALERYAQTLGCELQAFAVDAGQFGQRLGVASSPLLLDEFYRSACWLAGAYPIWWLVPPQLDEAHYQPFVQQLHRGEWLRPNTWIDFGACGTFTTEDLAAAMIRILQSSLSDPHKSLLKLALLETYANGAQPLSHTYKENIYQGGEGDAYLLLADHLDAYFAHEPARLSVLRRAWISKTSRKNARLADNHAWQQRANRWGFTEQHVNHQRWPERWTVADFIDEHEHLQLAYQPAWSLLDHLCATCSELPKQQQLQLQRLRERFDATPLLINPAPGHSAEVDIQIDTHGTTLIENDRLITQARSLTGIVSWLIQHGFGLNALKPQWRQNPYLQQVFDVLQTPGSCWLISTPGTTVETILAQVDDPLCHGHRQLNLVQQCEYISADHGTVEPASVAAMVACVAGSELPREQPVKVVGNLLRAGIEKFLMTLIREAQCAMKVPDALFIFPVGKQFVILRKTYSDTVQFSEVAALAAVFEQAPAATPIRFSTQSYFTPSVRALLLANQAQPQAISD